MIDISIIYIATGPYIRYWPEFHRSAETFLFRGSTRKYFLATDDINIVSNSTYENTSVINIEHKPWPMPTLERFKTFIKLKPEIDSYLPKLILFFNANTRFHKPVHLKDVLPDESQSLVGVQHPGFDGLHPFLCPFERRKRLTCSLPWAYSKPYLQGCLLGGLSNAFWDMSYQLSELIDEDIKNNKIPIWHDESYWNWYCKDKNVRVLPPSYAYPWRPQTMIPRDINILMEIKANIRPQSGKNVLIQCIGRPLRRIISNLLWRLVRV